MQRRLTLAAGVLMAGCLAVQASYEQKVDEAALPVVLPKPMFTGTVKPLKVPNLEPSRDGKKRPDFFAPKGTVNLAAKKPVTGSDKEPVIGELDYVTDGDKEGGDGSYVELGPGKQYVQIDLEQSASIYALLVWHFHGQACVYHDVVVQVSADADFITGVTTVYNNDHDNSSGFGIGKDLAYIETNEGRLIDAKGVKGRYVRLYSKGNTSSDMNHYTEVEVFGVPAK